jgi:Ankyrin repeats (3 copies)
VSDPRKDDAIDEALAERYRNASAVEASRPSPALRNAILARAREVAAGNGRSDPAQVADARDAANDSNWRFKAVAGVAVVCVASLVAVHLHDSPMRQAEPRSGGANEPNGPVGPPAGVVFAPSPAPVPAIPPSVPVRQSGEVQRDRAVGKPAQPATSVERPPTDAISRLAETDGRGLPRAPPASAAIQPSNTPPAEHATENAQADLSALKATPSAAPSPTVSRERSRARADSQNSPLVDAAAAGDLPQVDNLLRGGASTEQADALGRTPLLMAALYARTDVVRRLLAAGANVNAAAKNGDTPLAVAQRQGSSEILKLMQVGADAN